MNILLDTNLLIVTHFEADELLAYIIFAIGLTLIGLFSKYKIFLLITLGPITYLLYHISDSSHEGYQILMVCLASWLIFNVYAAFSVDKNE